MTMTLNDLISVLHKENCSCVIANADRIEICRQRGVKDLLQLLKSDISLLCGSMIADKVVGKGAAALMCLGGVAEVYADVISEQALELFDSEKVKVSYGECVPNIINRARTGICPVENICVPCRTAAECLPLIENFVKSMNN